jgi:hypothetical protein
MGKKKTNSNVKGNSKKAKARGSNVSKGPPWEPKPSPQHLDPPPPSLPRREKKKKENPNIKKKKVSIPKRL